MDADAERLAIESAQDGSQQAWRQLFDWHFDAVYRYCLLLAAGRQDIAEEVSQQAFITAAQCVCRFRSQQGTFRAWLYGIAQNRHLTLAARERRRRVHETLPRQAEGGSNGALKPETMVHDVLARLPFDYRHALEDKYLRRLTLREMAEDRGSSIEAIESLLRRARDRFASVYERMEKQQ